MIRLKLLKKHKFIMELVIQSNNETSNDDQSNAFNTIWDLEYIGKREDQDRLRYFLELIFRFTQNISEKLEERKHKDPETYAGRRYLFQFSLDQETESNKEWILFNWPIIQKQFKTTDFHTTKHSVRLVTNVLRHIIKWMNNHYTLQHQIFYENKDVWTIDPKTNKGKNKKMSFISF